MKAEDLRSKSEDELTKLLLDTRKEQFNLRFQRSQGALEKTHDMRNTKRAVARIKTILGEKAAGTAAAPAKAKKAKPAAAAKKADAPKKKETSKKAAPKKAASKKSA